MYISRVYIKNYRNFKDFDLFIPNGNPLTIIGGNNVGKTNLLNAIRLVLDSQMPPWERILTEKDFSWSLGADPWRVGEEIVITLTLTSISSGEEANEFIQSLTSINKTENTEENTFNGNLSFVFAPESKNKNIYNIHEDYKCFFVAGKYHPSGYEIDNKGEKIDYPTDLKQVFAGICKDDLSDLYKYFYLSTDDLDNLKETSEKTAEGYQITPFKQLYSGKIRKRINLLYLDALRDVTKNFFEGYNSVVSQLIRYKIELNATNDTEYYAELSNGLEMLRNNDLLTQGSNPVIPKSKLLLDETESTLKDPNLNLLHGKADLQIGTPSINQNNISKYFNFLSNLVEDANAPKNLQINELGLGYQNLAYISAIFAIFELKKRINNPESAETNKIFFNILLTEEPEAHLDVQNQKDLHTQIENKTEQLQKLIKVSDDSQIAVNTFTQVIQTSHSTHLASKSNLENIIVLEKCQNTTQPVNINNALKIDNSTSYEHDRRILHQYLDATRSAMLFAKKVILVEGASEKFAIPTLLNLYLQSSDSILKSVDKQGIEIVEIGFKGYDSFYALYGNTEGKLHNKCLGLIDGDYHTISDDNTTYSLAEIYKNSNNSNVIENIKKQKNIYTFEIDTFLIPTPTPSGKVEEVSKNNLEWLKFILKRFYQENKYYQTQEKFNEKMKLIEEFTNNVETNHIDVSAYNDFFNAILYSEVSKPTVSLYLSSLIKAKHLNDKREIMSWDINELKSLPDFIFPEFLEDGFKWLLV